jgi:hydrogenase expression/formation protein HypC
MCIGVPMQVIESHDTWAWCAGDDDRERVDMRLIGPRPTGTWVLVFLGAAREVMGETEALRVRDALLALDAVRRGDPIDHLFADLIDREPQLPAHLAPGRSSSSGS